MSVHYRITLSVHGHLFNYFFLWTCHDILSDCVCNSGLPLTIICPKKTTYQDEGFTIYFTKPSCEKCCRDHLWLGRKTSKTLKRISTFTFVVETGWILILQFVCVVAYLISKLKILLPHMESEMLMIIICAVPRFSSASFI